MLKSDLGYYVVVDLQQNHLNYELREEEVIKFWDIKADGASDCDKYKVK